MKSKSSLQIIDSTPWHIEIQFRGKRAEIAADAAAEQGLGPDFLAYRSTDQTWKDGAPMSETDRDEILGLLREAGRKRGWTIDVA